MRHLNFLAAKGRHPAQPARMGIHLKPQAPQAGSTHATSAPHLQRSNMDPMTKTHTVPHPNTGINPAKTRKIASPHVNAWYLQCRGPAPCGQKRSPTSKNLPWSSTPHPKAITSASQMRNSPSPAQLMLQLPVKQLAGPTSDQCPVTLDIP